MVTGTCENFGTFVSVVDRRAVGRVEAGDIVMVVESDKADMDVEAFESGYLAKILVPEGSSGSVGSAVALLVQVEQCT